MIYLIRKDIGGNCGKVEFTIWSTKRSEFMSNDIINTDFSHYIELESIASMLSHEFSKQPIATEQQLIIPDQLGQGSIRRMNIKEGLEIIISDMELSKDLAVYVEDDCHYVEMNYCLSGETVCEMNRHRYNILEPKSHMYYSHDTKTQLDIKANVRNHMVEIRMLPRTLLSYFDYDEDKERIRKMLVNQKGQMTSYSLSPLIKNCVFDILQCAYRGAMKKMYYEAKTMELITLFFQEEVLCNEYSHRSLDSVDIKKLQKARAIILNCLDDPFSIKQLAKEVGLNEFQLKKEFKQLYGTTIFGLIRSERMEKAAWLMKVEGYNVSETASILGYSNFSNFTVAFRKHFGYNPSDYLKQKHIIKY